MMGELQQNVVMKEGKGSILEEIAKASDVMGNLKTEVRKEEYNQKIHPMNSWLLMISMILCLMFVFVTGNIICSTVEEVGSSNEMFAGQRKRMMNGNVMLNQDMYIS